MKQISGKEIARERPKSKRKKLTRDADGSIFKKTETINGKKCVVWYARKRYKGHCGHLA